VANHNYFVKTRAKCNKDEGTSEPAVETTITKPESSRKDTVTLDGQGSSMHATTERPIAFAASHTALDSLDSSKHASRLGRISGLASRTIFR
jgi:hypothetical protein